MVKLKPKKKLCAKAQERINIMSLKNLGVLLSLLTVLIAVFFFGIIIYNGNTKNCSCTCSYCENIE